MSNPTRFKRARRAGIALALGFALIAVPLVAVPTAAQSAPVDLGTAGPFVVLGGSAVTNTGPSVLGGNLGVAPGTALTGFGPPAVVNGAIHNNNAVANQAQLDLTTAYDVAAGQPVLPGDDLSGTDLGNRMLTAGAYRYTSSAQLTGPLTLDAEGDPNAQFVFLIGSALTTAPASSVVLVNGASPCNVYWQVGTSATLDTTTAFQGNLMALASISLNNGATVRGRVLARNGQVSLINNVLDASMCATDSSTPPDSPGGPPGGPPTTDDGTPTSGDGTPGANQAQQTNRRAGNRGRSAGRNGLAIMRRAQRPSCVAGFRATVRGNMIASVVFRLDGRRISSQRNSPYRVYVRAAAGGHNLRARVTFRDNTRAKTMTLRYRACAQALLQPRSGPSQFTG